MEIKVKVTFTSQMLTMMAATWHYLTIDKVANPGYNIGIWFGTDVSKGFAFNNFSLDATILRDLELESFCIDLA